MKLNVILFSLALLFFAPYSFSQSWQWASAGAGNENASAGALDVDEAENSYAAGTFVEEITFGSVTLSAPSITSVYIVKYDPAGQLLWARSVGSSTMDISVHGICVHPDGGISVTGNYAFSALLGDEEDTLTAAGNYDVYLAHFNNSGDLMWSQSLGDTGFDYGAGVGSDASGNIYLTGEFHQYSFGGSPAKAFISKYDSEGVEQWMNTADDFTNAICNDIATDENGTSYITGNFFDTMAFDSILLDAGENPELKIFLVKFDSDGNAAWLRQAGNGGYAGGWAVTSDGQGNVFLTGFFRGSISFGSFSVQGTGGGLIYDSYIVKCDENGNFIWGNKLYGSGSTSAGTSVSATVNGDCVVGGYFFDAITADASTVTSTGGRDVFLAKINSSGDFTWLKQCGGTYDDALGDISVKGEELFVTGNFLGTVDFDDAGILVNDTNSYDVFTGKLSMATAIHNETATDIAIFPNPCADILQIRGLANGDGLTIYNALGEILYAGIARGNMEINLSSYSKGMYYLKVVTSDTVHLSHMWAFEKV